MWLPRESLLTFEEIAGVVDAFTPLGVDRVRITGGEPLLRRDLPVLIESLAVTPGDCRSRADDQWRAARRPGAGAAGGGPPPHHRQPRHAAARSVPGADPHGRTRHRARGHRCGGHARDSRGLKLDTVVIRGVNDDELVALLEYGRRDGSRGALHRVHGRRRRHALDPRRRRVPSRDTRAPRSALRCGAADRRTVVRPGGPLSSARRNQLRDHLVDDGAVLRFVRPQPPHRRRRLAPVPVRGDAAPTCGGRSAPARPRPISSGSSPRSGRCAPIAAPKSASRWIARQRSSRSARSSAMRTSRCTPGGDEASRDSGLGSARLEGANSKYPGSSIQPSGSFRLKAEATTARHQPNPEPRAPSPESRVPNPWSAFSPAW